MKRRNFSLKAPRIQERIYIYIYIKIYDEVSIVFIKAFRAKSIKRIPWKSIKMANKIVKPKCIIKRSKKNQ